MEEIKQKLRSVELCLSAHPDNEEHSEFADRISDLQELREQFEYLKSELDLRKRKLNVAENALNDILVWQEDVDGKWDYPETIASNALEKLAKIDGF